MRRRWTSWPRRVAALLLAGTALTYAVAWGCERWSATLQVSRSVTQDKPPSELPIALPAASLARRNPKSSYQGFVFERYAGTGVETGLCYTYEQAHLSVHTYLFAYSRAGWPLRAVQCETERDLWTPSTETISGAARLSKTPGSAVLALRPLFPGFALDVAIYAAGAFLLVQIAAAVRRGLRVRARRCAACGYDRRGLAANAKCPECGTVPAPASK